MTEYSAELIEVHLKQTFRTSRGESSSKNNCIVRLGNGIGECCPSLHYGYSAEGCFETINQDDIRIDDPLEVSLFLDRLEEKYGDKKSLLAGLDMALFDYICKQLDLPLHQYLGIPEPENLTTSYTISIDKPENIESRLKDAEGFEAVKVKIGSEYDRENLEKIAAQNKYKIRVDANGAFTMDKIENLIPFLNDLNLELVEQPLADSDPIQLRELRNKLNAPIFLDESIVEVEDIFRYVNAIDGINIKLQRVGGIRTAMKMIQAARSVGMKIMFGCMLETNIGNSAAARMGAFADFLDLDSSYLLADDPFEGITIDHGKIMLPDRPGIGVIRRTDD